MSENQVLYRKVMKGRATRYEAVPMSEVTALLGLPVDDDIVTTVEFNDEECTTVAGSLGITLLMLLERTRPKMKNGSPSLCERKIKNVHTSVVELFRGTGCKLRLDIAEGVMRTWDTTMQRIANEGIDDSLIKRSA